jgi:hypothetical protein
VTVRALGTTFLLPPLFACLSWPCAASTAITDSWEVTPCEVLAAMRKSQTRIPPSRPPVLRRLSCWGSHTTVLTVLVCPRKRCRVLPVATSVIRVVWSPEQVAKEVSPVDHCRSNIPFSWMSRSTRFGAGRLNSCDNLAQARVLTELTNLALMLLASKYPKCTLFPVRSQRPDGERRHVSQLTTISLCGPYAHVPGSETYHW